MCSSWHTETNLQAFKIYLMVFIRFECLNQDYSSSFLDSTHIYQRYLMLAIGWLLHIKNWYARKICTCPFSNVLIVFDASLSPGVLTDANHRNSNLTHCPNWPSRPSLYPFLELSKRIYGFYQRCLFLYGWFNWSQGQSPILTINRTLLACFIKVTFPSF